MKKEIISINDLIEKKKKNVDMFLLGNDTFVLINDDIVVGYKNILPPNQHIFGQVYF